MESPSRDRDARDARAWLKALQQGFSSTSRDAGNTPDDMMNLLAIADQRVALNGSQPPQNDKPR